ncbi:HAMP domain-containing histidine kinase [Pedobacter polaris]|uniref:histidine kinase n=1 Tax=Pedobacter polaris TaxID=2571273 RepID=A0A4U1CJU2_9SPHI|nr:HAMP domain-containing sensor histidine kinase [Pedobacter polaris]TKC07904.1 HAMP domain-containing histidine kinase [Pedobacter polaris]
MEYRIFNAVSIFSAIGASINAIINFAIGLTFYGYIMLPLIGILLLGYYLSRYKNQLGIAVGIFAVSFNALCGGTYFAAAGSNGVNLYTFIVIIFILAIVSPKKQFWIWIPSTLIFLIVLLTLEYNHPEYIKTIYVDENHKLLDLSQTIFEVIIMIIVITMFMKKSYNREKILASNRLVALEKSNDTKNKLFSIVAHDLRAPLASIENYLSLLNQLDLNKEEKLEIEKQLLASTRQTSEMLQNILSWSKDQMDGIHVKLSAIAVYETLHHTLLLQKNIAKEKGIKLNYTIAQDLIAIADPDMLQLIIRNLVNNAIKFSLPNGKIDLIATIKNNKCLISINDNGIGIDDDQKQLVFSLKNKSTYGTNKEKGVGLGLRLAKTYVELLNGEIWFESDVSKGTTFYVSLASK